MEKQSQIITKQLSAFDSLCLSNVIIDSACRMLYKQSHMRKIKKSFIEFYIDELQGYKKVVCPALAEFLDTYSNIDVNFYMYMFAESPKTPAIRFREPVVSGEPYIIFKLSNTNALFTYTLDGAVKEQCLTELNKIIKHLENSDELFTLYELYENSERKKIIAKTISKEIAHKQHGTSFTKSIFNFKKTPKKTVNAIQPATTKYKPKKTGVVQLSLPEYPINMSYPSSDKYSRVNTSTISRKRADPFKTLKNMERLNISKAKITKRFVDKHNESIRKSQKHDKFSTYF